MSARFIFQAGLLATLGLSAAHAQTTPDQTAPAQGQGRMGRQADMLKELNLTADQQTKVQALMSENRAAMMNRPSGPPTDAERQAMQTRRTEMEAKLKEILTPEQYAKYEAMRPQRGQRPAPSN
jgi:Spy/CpxP family protein refolding chaperone